MPVLECPEAVDEIKENDDVEIDLSVGKIIDHTSGKTYGFPPYPDNLRRIIDAGGLKKYYQELHKKQ